jgi:hypothetical protein
MIWTEAEGLRDLNVVVQSLGLSTDGWLLRGATGVSDDGLVIVGNSVNAQNQNQAWMLRLPARPTCDSIDFNNDASLFDPTDIDAFLSVFSEGPCIPEEADCNDLDFNNDGSIFDPCDVDSFILVFSEGPCTLCGT